MRGRLQPFRVPKCFAPSLHVESPSKHWSFPRKRESRPCGMAILTMSSTEQDARAVSAAHFQWFLVSNCDQPSEQYGTDTQTTRRYNGWRCKN